MTSKATITKRKRRRPRLFCYPRRWRSQTLTQQKPKKWSDQRPKSPCRRYCDYRTATGRHQMIKTNWMWRRPKMQRSMIIRVVVVMCHRHEGLFGMTMITIDGWLMDGWMEPENTRVAVVVPFVEWMNGSSIISIVDLFSVQWARSGHGAGGNMQQRSLWIVKRGVEQRRMIHAAPHI